MNQGQKVAATRWLFLLFIVLGLEVLVRRFGVHYVIVAPSAMLHSLWRLLSGGDLAPHMGATAAEILVSFLIAVLLGVPAGVLLGVNRTLKQILDPYLVAYYAVPIFAFYPLLISFFGLGILPIIAIGTLNSVLGIVANTALGVQKVKTTYLKVGRSLRMTWTQLVLKVYLPASVPYVFTGMRLGLVYCFLAVITSEFILAAEGLGYYVKFQYASFRTEEMYATATLIVASAVVLNSILIRLENKLYRRGI